MMVESKLGSLTAKARSLEKTLTTTRNYWDKPLEMA
jgi:hypothetical protein